jgi:general secretion pathway protein D
MRDDLVVNESKIPLLGDIPLLGWLFKTQSKTTTKLSLLVFLTPHLLKDEADIARLNTDKVIETEAVQREANYKEPSGGRRKVTEKLLGEQPVPDMPDREPAEGSSR